MFPDLVEHVVSPAPLKRNARAKVVGKSRIRRQTTAASSDKISYVASGRTLNVAFSIGSVSELHQSAAAQTRTHGSRAIINRLAPITF